MKRRAPSKDRAQLKKPLRQNRVIYDVLYGFIPITECEEKLINSPFFQRLRWIKQLGFSNYIFPGAEHNRFAHTIGVMHSMDTMIRALGLAVSDQDLFDSKSRDTASMLHKTLRLSALLHDIGTFPFSHAIEFAYMRHGNHLRRGEKGLKNLPNSHEHLGSFIIKNTDYPGGITRVLQDYGFDVQFLSDIIKGQSDVAIANQLMHSDLDADRMDYLLRDSHYTGIKYGQFDRDYIMANLVPYSGSRGTAGFAVRENAIHAVEDFLMARFWWYSQVIKHPGSAKFDIMSSHIAEDFLVHDHIYQFQDLLEMIKSGDERFYWWNDMYFIDRALKHRFDAKWKDPRTNQLVEMLLYRIPPKTLSDPLFRHCILEGKAAEQKRIKKVRAIQERLKEIESTLKRKKGAWILADIPQKDVTFTSRIKPGEPDRNSIKIAHRDQSVNRLIEDENSLVRRLGDLSHFIPSVYANDAAYEVLRDRLGMG